MFMLLSSGGVRRLVGIEAVISSFGGISDSSHPWIERARAVALGHLGQWNDLDLRGMACGAELLEALTAEVAQTIHRPLQEFARIEFAFALHRHLAERSGHRQPAVGVDIDLANAMP